MAQDRTAPNAKGWPASQPANAKTTYYSILGVSPSASAQEVRQAYRELSKLYHPDTTQLSQAEATTKFHELNEAYATLSNPERRLLYDQQVGYSRYTVIQPPSDLHTPAGRPSTYSSSAYLDPNDRALSPGELFALFILALTFIACLGLAVAIGLTDGDTKFQMLRSQTQQFPQPSLLSKAFPHQLISRFFAPMPASPLVADPSPSPTPNKLEAVSRSHSVTAPPVSSLPRPKVGVEDNLEPETHPPPPRFEIRFTDPSSRHTSE